MRMRNIALFADLELVYGTAVALAGDNAIRTSNLKVTPFVAQTVDRKLDGAKFGNSGAIHTGPHIEIEFDVEMAGSGVVGTAPAYGLLFKACQMTESLVAGTSVTYSPNSSGTDSLTMYVELDGQRHATKGARGTWSIKFDSQGIPYLHFKFTGLWIDPVSAAALAPDFSGFKTPRPVTFAFTPKISLHGLSSVYRSFSYDHANDVQFFDNPGEQFVDIMDRKPAGNVSLLAPTLATKNYFTTAMADTTGALTLIHGMTAGNIITFAAPNVQLLEPNYADDKGRAMLDAKLGFVYVAGDDEMSLAFT